MIALGHKGKRERLRVSNLLFLRNLSKFNERLNMLALSAMKIYAD